jgi:hypothetical protein
MLTDGAIAQILKSHLDAQGAEPPYITDTQRLDFVISAKTSWYPNARDGTDIGILCYDCGGNRAEAFGKTMREAIDAAINAS